MAVIAPAFTRSFSGQKPKKVSLKKTSKKVARKKKKNGKKV